MDELLVKELNKKYGDIIKFGCTMPKQEFIPFSSPTLNYLARGGVCENKMVEFYGTEGSAKTTLALDIIKNFQVKYPDKTVLYLDAENTLDEEWGNLLGVNWETVLLIKPEDEPGEVLLDMVVACVKSGDIGLVIIDSIPFLMSKQEFENDLDKKTYGGNSAMMTTFSRKVVPLLHSFSCTCICINQMRDVIGSMFPMKSTPGGKMLRHAYVQRFYLQKGKYFDEKGRELTNSAEFPVGHKVQVKLEKNKVTKNDRKLATFSIDYSKGIDILSDTIELATLLGVIDKRGAWFYVTYGGEDLKFQGKAKLTEELERNKELREYIIQETNKEAIL